MIIGNENLKELFPSFEEDVKAKCLEWYKLEEVEDE